MDHLAAAPVRALPSAHRLIRTACRVTEGGRGSVPAPSRAVSVRFGAMPGWAHERMAVADPVSPPPGGMTTRRAEKRPTLDLCNVRMAPAANG